ncbi:MAG: hypothetical protein M3Y72_20155 [Acidobacteriota bacterium]|nr:hypothetical protein [Acidobacteriota bacterium]
MSSYISSNANRFYTAVEAAYGQAASVVTVNRFPAVHLHAHQTLQVGRRFDKTGTRTFLGSSKSARRQTAFEVQTYLTSWSGSGGPSYGPLFQAALGAGSTLSTGLIVASMPGPLQLQTTLPHGLGVGSAVGYGNEIRFVAALIDNLNFVLNAPFKTAAQQGTALAPALTYSLGNALPSVTIYDYWDPIAAVSRVIVGAAVEAFGFTVNGDFHEFTFSGPAADLLDSASFVPGTSGLANFPVEPALETFDYSIVPGHLGEVWLGGPANQFFTLTSASLQLKNNVETRGHEYGSSIPMSIAPGPREVLSRFSLLAQDDAQTVALYAASKQRQPIPAMLQMGQQQGQLAGIYMPQIVPEIPVFNDSETRLQWDFENNLAQGMSNDEIFIAFA